MNAQGIFQDAGGSLSADIPPIITGVVMLLASAVTPLIVDRLGRRLLFLISGVGMAVAHVRIICFLFKIN